MLKRVLALAFAGFVLAGASATAQAPAPQQAAPQGAPQQIPQATLTPETVERFISSYKDIDALTKKFEQENAAMTEGGQRPSAAMMQRFQQQKAEIDATATKHGFKDFADWSVTAYSVGMAVAFADGQGSAGPIKQIEAQRDQIRNNAQIPAQQKQQMEQMIEQQLAYLKTVKPLDGNIEAVTPYLDMLKGLKAAGK